MENYGKEELEQIQDSRVAVVGLGATGSAIAENLARHGAELVLVDRDYLEMNDCYSSSLYTPEDCEKALPKAEAAGEKLSKFTEVETHTESLKPENTGILDNADIVMDGTDNMETRFLINEYCRKEEKPWIYTAALGEKGYSMMFNKKCFNCLFDDITPGELETCETAGIMRDVAAGTASISSLKAVRFLAGKQVEEKLDTFRGESLEVEGGSCEVCGEESFPRMESRTGTVSVCGENKYQLEKEVGEKAFEKLRERSGEFTENDYLLRADIDGRSFTLFRSGRAIVEARDSGHAETLFAEIIGV